MNLNLESLGEQNIIEQRIPEFLFVRNLLLKFKKATILPYFQKSVILCPLALVLKNMVVFCETNTLSLKGNNFLTLSKQSATITWNLEGIPQKVI